MELLKTKLYWLNWVFLNQLQMNLDQQIQQIQF